MVSFHSHMLASAPPTWIGRQLVSWRDPQTNRIHMPKSLGPWMPMLAWAGSTAGFLVAFVFYKKELFKGESGCS